MHYLFRKKFKQNNVILAESVTYGLHPHVSLYADILHASELALIVCKSHDHEKGDCLFPQMQTFFDFIDRLRLKTVIFATLGCFAPFY